jgi:hypothetical protein
MKRTVAIVGLMLLASPACADPQAEISAYRKTHGLSAVTVDAKLTELARQQANAMAARGSLDHDVYASFRSRVASYGAPSAVENIAMGTRTFKETLAVWKNSSGHNANLLSRSATKMGLASATGQGGTYWALIMAAAPAEPKQRNAAPAQPKQRNATPAEPKQRNAAPVEPKPRSATVVFDLPFMIWFRRTP